MLKKLSSLVRGVGVAVVAVVGVVGAVGVVGGGVAMIVLRECLAIFFVGVEGPGGEV